MFDLLRTLRPLPNRRRRGRQLFSLAGFKGACGWHIHFYTREPTAAPDQASSAHWVIMRAESKLANILGRRPHGIRKHMRKRLSGPGLPLERAAEQLAMQSICKCAQGCWAYIRRPHMPTLSDRPTIARLRRGTTTHVMYCQ